LAQTGWKYDGGNCLTLFGRTYRFHHSREITGQVKTVTIKRLPTGRMEIMFSCLCEEETIVRGKTGQTAAFDFGLTQFLTGHNGHDIHAPQPLKSSLRQVRKANRALSRKQLGSGHRRQAKHTLAMAHRRIAHQRSAWHWDTAQALCERYDTIYLEDLELRGMSAMWGRKVADLGFGRFVQVLHQAAVKHGTHVHHVDRWFPSTKRCHVCKYVNHAITLRDRTWTCPGCQTFHHRDRNASLNLHQEGASSCERGGCKTRLRAATV
jgi:putative transposase